MNTYDHFIGGAACLPAEGKYADSRSPASLEIVASVAQGTQIDVDQAVEAAKQALPKWRETKPLERGRILNDIARKLREERERLGGIESAETGKPAFQSPMEVDGAAAYFEFYAGLVNLPEGEVIPMGPKYHTYTLREPFGVVGVITPWNAPINQAARGIAPALASGNTVVAKPSEFTSATTVELAKIASDCGLPDGVLNVVLGTGQDVGAAIVSHGDVRKVAFTGSVRAGREIGAIAAERIIPVTLELGGKSANIIFEDANLAQAIPGSLRAFVGNAGQVCSAGTRLLVHEKLVEPVKEALKAALSQIQVGVQLGPVTTPAQFEKVKEYFEIANAEDLECVTGGQPAEADGEGYFVEPTIYVARDRDSRLLREEIFGPVLTILPFADEAEAIDIANDSDYGLAAGLWTQDITRAHRVASALEAGQVFVNDWVAGTVETPFGGYKMSGIGREKGIEALHHYTQVKCVVVKL